MAAVWELVAFVLRTVGARKQQETSYAVLGTLFFLLAPLCKYLRPLLDGSFGALTDLGINAFVYMTIARLVHFVLPERQVWRISASWLTKLFVGLDVLSFLVQAGGAVTMSQDGEHIVRVGQVVYMVGMGVQGLFIIVFSAMTGNFYSRVLHLDRPDRDLTRVKRLVWSMCAVLVLIMVSLNLHQHPPHAQEQRLTNHQTKVRIIFRLIELGPGVSRDNPILTNENYAFGLDALPMLVALVLLNIMHPGLVLRGQDSEFPRLSKKEKKTLKQERKDAERVLKEEKRRAKSSHMSGRTRQVTDNEHES